MTLHALAEFFNTEEDFRMLRELVDGHEALNEKINQKLKNKIDLREFEKKLEKELDKSIIRTLDKVFK